MVEELLFYHRNLWIIFYIKCATSFYNRREKYYRELLKTPAVINAALGKSMNEFVSPSTVRDVHKLLRSCFKQAVKWELMQSNPADNATVPKYTEQKRAVWSADILMQAIEACENKALKLALNLSFACSLRIGELLGLTWDCVEISDDAIQANAAFVFVNKEVQRVTKAALKELDEKDIIAKFPGNSSRNKTMRILKTPKTESSVRKVFLPQSVAKMLREWKEEQEEIKDILGDEYKDFNLVMATNYGLPIGNSYLRSELNKLIKENELPQVVFHSIRHTSVTYKLKLNGGDIKAVQGDSGHSQVDMVTNVYSHIIDEDRRHNAELFERAFYAKQDLNPQIHNNQNNSGGQNMVTVPDGMNAELLGKILANPEMLALLTSMASAMQK